MSRYAAMFDRLGGECAFGAFLMLGDPDLEASARLLDAVVESGADMVEVGIPFSDPVADGPVIQAAAQRALAAGVTVTDCFALIADFRARHPDVPIGILTYANWPVIQAAAQRALAAGVRVGECLDLIRALRARNNHVPIGILTYANIVVARPGFMRDAAEAGVDSLLIADVPALEAEPLVNAMEQAGIEPVLIAAANTPDATVRRIATLSKAYTYCVSRAGITGTHAGGQFDPALIARVEAAGVSPPVFGFGISKPEHVRAAIEAGAKGVICGSAIVDCASRGGNVVELIRTLKDSTRNESVPQ